jgi:HD-GYP domain-containing protein (c-di-GMP phosphodiesterase class II)
MKSLFTQLSIFTRVSIALVLLIAVSFGSYLYIGGQSRQSTDDYRTILTLINSSISTLHDLELEQTGPEESEVLQALIDELIMTIDRSEHRFVLSATRLHEKWRSEFRGAPSELIECLGRVARMVGESYREKQGTLYHWSLANTVTFFALTLFMLVWLIRFRNAIGSFFATISESIGQLQNLIAYRNYDISLEPRWREEEELLETITYIGKELTTDRSLSEMNVDTSLEEFLPKLKKLVETNIPCNRLALAFLSPNGDITAESAVTDRNVLHLEPGFVEPLSRSTLDVIVNSAYPRIINDLEAHYNTVHKSEATELILKEGLRSSLTAPIVINGKTIGFLFINSAEKNAYTEYHIYHALQLVNPLRQNIYYQYLLQQVIAETAKSFVVLMEKKDNETSLHITRMSLYSHHIAKKLFEQEHQINPRLLREILWFAPLHDIGKIGIPDGILLKPGKLTKDEFTVMQQHVTIGEQVITKMDEALTATANLSALKTAIDLISSHHERWDGKGYPRGLPGRDIPLSGRIVAVADVFDALTSRRPYKEAYSIEKTLEIMRASVGTQFDPWVFNAFEEALPQILRTYEEYKEV